MPEISSSIADNLAKKLHLSELTKEDQVTALLGYFAEILTNKVKTSPQELKALLDLFYEMLRYDQQATVNKYILNHQSLIDSFFQENSQRFDRFEFKPYFLRLKGIDPGKAFQVPVNDKRNFSHIVPLDIKPYAGLLEPDPISLEINRKQTAQLDFRRLQELKQAESKKIEEEFQALQKTVQEKIQQGKLTKEVVMADIKTAVENCIPALQIEYNAQSLEKLVELILQEVKSQKDYRLREIFQELKLPFKQQEKLCKILLTKLA
jgi:hypothetical protein